MKSIAILEYVAGGGFRQKNLDAIPDSLRREGFAMLRAVAVDFAAVGLNVHVAIDDRLSWPPVVGNVFVKWIAAQDDCVDRWCHMAQGCDYVLVIAPESEACLVKTLARLRSRLSDNTILLNCSLPFVETASDKYATYLSLKAANIDQPLTFLLSHLKTTDDPKSTNGKWFGTVDSPMAGIDKSFQRWVLKRRDGAGCDGMKLFVGDLSDAIAQAQRLVKLNEHDRWILQPWLDGVAASIVALDVAGKRSFLPVMRQHIAIESEGDGTEQIVYRGGDGPWTAIDRHRVEGFAGSILDAVPGPTAGWIGIDFLLMENGVEGAKPCCIEINPRWTTSYLGLRELLGRTWIPEVLLGARERGGLPAFNSSIEFDVFGVVRRFEVD